MPGILAAIALATLAVAPLAAAEEQTRETYRARVEPFCKANREANERIMAGARRRVNKNRLARAGKQFIRVSESFGKLIRRLAPIPPPLGDERRVKRWLKFMRLLELRLRKVGRYFREGEKIKATHQSILAERSGLSANNISIVFHLRYCRFSRFDRNG